MAKLDYSLLGSVDALDGPAIIRFILYVWLIKS